MTSGSRSENIISSKYVVSYSILKAPKPQGACEHSNVMCGVTVWGGGGGGGGVCQQTGDDLLFPSAANGFPFFVHVSVAGG